MFCCFVDCVDVEIQDCSCPGLFHGRVTDMKFVSHEPAYIYLIIFMFVYENSVKFQVFVLFFLYTQIEFLLYCSFHCIAARKSSTFSTVCYNPN